MAAKTDDALDDLIAADDPNIDRNQALDGIYEDDSPYPEVRSAVANTDDPGMPVSTIRVYVMGILWAILVAGLNQFFFFRYPSVGIGGGVILLASLAVGRAWAKVMPNWHILGHSLNPGPFTIKEHALVVIMATVGGGSAYATDIVAVQRVYYGQTYNFVCFSMGGILRRFLVNPPSMIWPDILVSCAFFNTLHTRTYAGMGGRGGVSRERLFLYVCIAAAIWYFFPGYIFMGLSYFSWVCWIAPNNIKINQMFGYFSGLGMSLISFDWNQIAYIGSPLATPWWAEANIAVGFVIFFWLVAPCIYYTNTWYSKYLPMSSRISYDNTGAPYDVSRIINPDASFNLTAYEEYSPLFLSTTFALAYGLSFASITSTLVHAILFFRKQIFDQSRRSINEQPDIHARLMSKYKQVPDWWYVVIFGVITIEVWHTEFPVWAFCLSLALAFLFAVPIGMITAITNFGFSVISELIIGYILPGRPIAMMMFKTWSTITMGQALGFASDFKFGHYMKIPPRPMFWAQVVATMIAGTVQLGVQAWMFANIPDICTQTQKNGFICPNTDVFGTASIIWGVIGPQRQFSKDQ
ncbi:hypothetical protein ID866_9163, partial [Astraeus odoratus]